MKQVKNVNRLFLCVITACLLCMINSNIYAATTQAASVVMTVVQNFEAKGDIGQVDDRFIYQLQALDARSPMPAGAQNGVYSFEIKGSQTVNLPGINFDAEGTYKYEIKQDVQDRKKDYTYDERIFTIEVLVESGQSGELTAITVVKNDKGEKVTGIFFFNSYIGNESLGEHITITGRKSWDHGTNPFSAQPKSITVQLLADGEMVLSCIADADSHWRYSFTVPKYNENGKEISYTIDEVDVKDYQKTIHGFNITNTHISVLNPDGNNGGTGANNGADDANGNGAGNGTNGNPRTGDIAPPYIMMIAALIGVGGMVAVVIFLRRENKKT